MIVRARGRIVSLGVVAGLALFSSPIVATASPLQPSEKVYVTSANNKILEVDFPVKSDHTFKTKYITAQALPILTEDLLALQSPNVENISGATDTVVSFKKTLQSALLQAKKPT